VCHYRHKQDFFLLHHVLSDFEFIQFPIQGVPEAPSSGIKWTEREVDHSPSSSAKYNNLQSFISTPLVYIYDMTLSHMDSFAFPCRYHFYNIYNNLDFDQFSFSWGLQCEQCTVFLRYMHNDGKVLERVNNGICFRKIHSVCRSNDIFRHSFRDQV